MNNVRKLGLRRIESEKWVLRGRASQEDLRVRDQKNLGGFNKKGRVILIFWILERWRLESLK